MNCKHKVCPMLGISLIPLTQGKYAIVDTENYDYLMQWKWHVRPEHRTFYAVRRLRGSARKQVPRSTIFMHSVILQTPEGMLSDHRNHNGIDNRWCNMRVCSNMENCQNRLPPRYKNRTSSYKGVGSRGNNWQARITSEGSQIHIGTFRSEIEAARAYDEKATELFGNFARLNNV